MHFYHCILYCNFCIISVSRQEPWTNITSELKKKETCSKQRDLWKFSEVFSFKKMGQCDNIEP